MKQLRDNGTVDAILMASGYSRRFGSQNKLLTPLGGKPLALHVLQLVCGMPQFGKVFFVYADDAVGALAQGLPAQKLHNRHPSLGMRESIRLGVTASDADYYAFFPCDTPLLDAETISAVLENRAEGKIIYPECDGLPGNPAVFSSRFRQELLHLQQGQHAKDLKGRHPDSLIAVPVENAHVLADIDTVNDLMELSSALDVPL